LIFTNRELVGALKGMGDDNIICKYIDTNGNVVALVVDCVARQPRGGDGAISDICLVLRDGGQGCVKR